MPAAALTAVEAMERMASTGFSYGRATSEPGVWYFPTGKIGIYYADDGTTLTVQAVGAHVIPQVERLALT